MNERQTEEVIQQSTRRDQYDLVRDSYTGSGGYATGEHLFTQDKEYEADTRRAMASYDNLIKPIVDAKVDPVFIGEPQRPNDIPELYEAFLNDCDNNGASLKDVIHSTTTNTTLLGNSFIVMDSFPAKLIPDTMAEVIEDRKFPYIYTKEVQDVYCYETDIFGKLVNITFFYGVYTPSESDDEGYLYKSFTKNTSEMYAMYEDDNGISKKVILNTTKHDLGVVPVVYYNQEVLPFSPYFSMSTIARNIYNASSELVDLRRTQLLSILLMPSINAMGEPKDAVVVSKHNAIFYDANATNQPNYISPDAKNMENGIKYLEYLQQSLIQSADVLGSTAVATNGASSGISESYRFFGKLQALKISADIAKTLEMAVIELFGLFVGEEVDYSVTYNDNFAPTFGETKNKIEVLDSLTKMELGTDFDLKAKEDIITLVGQFMSWDNEELQNIIKNID